MSMRKRQRSKQAAELWVAHARKRSAAHLRQFLLGVDVKYKVIQMRAPTDEEVVAMEDFCRLMNSAPTWA